MNFIKRTQYIITLRQQLQKADNDLLQLTKEEVKREIERKSNKKMKGRK